MKKENIEYYLKTDQLRLRQRDLQQVTSMIKSAETNATVANSVGLNEDSATLIFREIYESIRQLGDAKWWLNGYEPRNHEVSIEILKAFEIKEKIMLNHLTRLKKIRHDANYRGYKVTVQQAEEIKTFWKKCATEIIASLKKELK
ncbi:MAG: hypothetical protein QS98_C0006G0007 [archaeon GW2011_AR3]|nr:MAG: hypothetical protein QS98_C0006G0007 [archaeon GW2011_AR3]MBS3109231.1 hypothetical protein [Candidatus Woesearchaeota archaeon]